MEIETHNFFKVACFICLRTGSFSGTVICWFSLFRVTTSGSYKLAEWPSVLAPFWCPRQWCGAQVPAWLSETPVLSTTEWPMVSQKPLLTDHHSTLMTMVLLGRKQKHGGMRDIVKSLNQIYLVLPSFKLLLSCFNVLTSGTIFSGHHRLFFLLFHFLAEYIHTSASTSQIYQYFTHFCKHCQNSFLSSKTQKYFAWSLLLLFQTWRRLFLSKTLSVFFPI